MESPCPRVGRTTLDLAFEGFLRNGRFSVVFCFQLPEGAFPMPLPKTPPTAAQWANIVGMLASAHAGSPAVHSACTWGQTEAQRDMSLRALYTELRNVKNMRRLESALRRPHPAALHADGFSAETRPRGRRIPTQILCHTKSHGRSIRRYRTLPAAPGGSRQRGRYLRVPGAG